MFDSVNDIEEIVEKTKGQHETRTWFDVRQPRITASKSKRCLLRPTTSPTKAVSEVLYPKQVQTNAMKDGIESESSIIQTFERETGNKVLKSGFFISDTHPFLGASPDGLVDEDKIVEVKKIVLKEGESLEDGMCRLGIYKIFEQKLVLNNNHRYYYQIQQRLFPFAILLFQVQEEPTETLFSLILHFGKTYCQDLKAFTLIMFFLNLCIQEF